MSVKLSFNQVFNPGELGYPKTSEIKVLTVELQQKSHDSYKKKRYHEIHMLAVSPSIIPDRLPPCMNIHFVSSSNK